MKVTIQELKEEKKKLSEEEKTLIKRIEEVRKRLNKIDKKLEKEDKMETELSDEEEAKDLNTKNIIFGKRKRPEEGTYMEERVEQELPKKQKREKQKCQRILKELVITSVKDKIVKEDNE